MVEIANTQTAASRSDVRFAPIGKRDRARANDAVTPLAAVATDLWRRLSDNAVEPNGYYLPEWEMPVNAFAQGRTAVSALTAEIPEVDGSPRLIGLIPVISAWRAYKLPVPALITADPYGTLGTPILDRELADVAVSQLMQHAREAGVHALILRDLTLDGPVMAAFSRVLEEGGLRPRILQSHARACLDATQNADELLRDALGPKKLKELRRQRNRLAEHGDVIFTVASAPDDVERDLEVFLALEASGWKAKRGTALAQNEGDLTFVRRAVRDAAARGKCEIITLHAGNTPVAGAIVLRHLDRAFYFKLGVDENFAKLSPGVQLTLELTRHMCADETIKIVDSTAIPGHPMIDPIWRGRLAIGDVLIPLNRYDPAVPLIRLALAGRQSVREPLRRIVHSIRKFQEKRS